MNGTSGVGGLDGPGSGAPVRRGIVLGAGGTLGAAWMIARLRALEVQRGFDAREVDLLVGSSAGSVLAAMITSGVSVQELLDHQRGVPGPGNPLARTGFDYDTSVGGTLPQRPPLRLGSASLLAQVARHPRRLGAMTALAAVLPPGRGTLDGLRAAVLGVARGDLEHWPDRPRLRICALDYRTGERVVFGAAGAPEASVVDAVAASCSIPGWFSPATVSGRTYIDAGFRQATSADLASGHDLDEVIVLSALASYAVEEIHPRRLGRLERRWRTHLTSVLERELSALDGERARVTVLTPDGDERRAMGSNLMDHRRRVRVLDVAELTAANAAAWRAGTTTATTAATAATSAATSAATAATTDGATVRPPAGSAPAQSGRPAGTMGTRPGTTEG